MQQPVGDFTHCHCIAGSDHVYKRPLVEIMQHDRGEGFNRGVRALSPISKEKMLSEYVGELIPLEQQGSRTFGDEKYCMKWWPQPRLNAGGRRANVQPDVEPIATLISGRQGSWTRFISHTETGVYVATSLVPIAGKWRSAVYALRDIDLGEEITMNYDTAAEGEKPRSDRGVVHRFRKALCVVAEERDDDF